ncbi:Transcriptional regulator GlxA family, contains an amidase domain and an AraC-type DNA-binding HTH domain [Arenibacter nanhaiticus]|uniref:Transcriptional regulator GlxA family, contains an amidase domain and an AraC-type DNA-binding HTH domain n=1 Tax=Arenibacter nanhaiticus TaxID=558155 RepID=A0A1M6M9L3_9FLAO|nr:helix-turn-helix domain-containing protein [Arenibacter nanhaiticus]SHJ80158.1 Transcriptional regulator GlxA family, contains an amidase domain and an AraC-type DNA-binding HTH domain [Arenibacter nanhaiticus]
MDKTTTKIYFYIPKQVTLLDLGGVLQVFQEAINLGFNYQLIFISNESTISCATGLEISSLTHYNKTLPQKNDILFISGFSSNQIDQLTEDDSFFNWLAKVNTNQTTICSICTGAFLLAKSGLLDNKECTTHWKSIDKLKTDFPKLRVQKNTLFTNSKNIYTSAGIVTGIDLALFLIEERHGKQNANKIAKELVVYRRRLGTDEQESIYLQNRNHQDDKIHNIQDWIIYNLDKTFTIEFLANLVHISPRNLTRIFKKKTGLTIAEYRTKLRVEKAKTLLTNTDYKIEYIAKLCGFNSSKQLRLILEKHLHILPSEIQSKMS